MPAGQWMLFFCLQAPLLLAEAWLRQLCRKAGVQLPAALPAAATLGLLHARESCNHSFIRFSQGFCEPCSTQQPTWHVLVASLHLLQWRSGSSFHTWWRAGCPPASCTSCGPRPSAAASAGRSGHERSSLQLGHCTPSRGCLFAPLTQAATQCGTQCGATVVVQTVWCGCCSLRKLHTATARN